MASLTKKEISLSQKTMASLLFKEMKGMNFSCASPASAAVCTSIDRRSMVRPTIIGKPIDRHLSHSRRTTKALSGQLPKPASKSRKSSDHSRPSTTRTSTSNSTASISTRDLTSPANSSRYLLDDKAFFDVYPEFEPSLALELFEKKSNASVSSSSTGSPRILKPVKENESSSTVVLKRSSVSWAESLAPIDSKCEKKSQSVLRPSNSTRSHHDQVVVLRVSLHCKGCEGKVRKHIAKMEGVTSFSIDFAAKKVTVKGDITPLGVLNSVSRVKNAQFWPSPPRASASF